MSNIVRIEYGDYIADIDLNNGAKCIGLYNIVIRAIILKNKPYNGNHYLCGAPLLFPANRIENGSFLFEGREYEFEVNEKNTNCHIHGVLHDAPFELVSCDKNKVVCAYTIHSRKGFEHDVTVEITYELSNEGLLTKLKLVNNSPYSLPAILGYHTTFNIAFTAYTSKPSVKVKAGIEGEIVRDKNFLPTGEILEVDEISKAFENGEFAPYKNPISRHCKATSNVMTITNTERKFRIVYEVDEKFKYRLIYNGDGEDFICLEPQTNMVNAPNLKGYENEIDVILPNTSKEYVTKIKIEQEN